MKKDNWGHLGHGQPQERFQKRAGPGREDGGDSCHTDFHSHVAKGDRVTGSLLLGVAVGRQLCAFHVASSIMA